MSQFVSITRASVVASVLLATAIARSEVTYTGGEGGETSVVRMTVTPAAEPVPAFKYRFQPRELDLSAGNAAPFYYRALSTFTPNFDRVRKKYTPEVLDTWYGPWSDTVPIEKLPLDKVREAVDSTLGGVVEDQLHLATTRRNCDWDIGLDEIRGLELIAVPLEEFQRSRDISRMLALRTRLAIAERRYDDAIDTMRTNYRMARNFATAPFLISGLIGIAEANITNLTVLDLVAAPDSPNLYWALSELPQPFVDLRPAHRFEMEFGLRMFPFIQNAGSTERSPDEWNRLYTEAVKDLSTLGGGGPQNLNEVGAGVIATAIGLAGYPHAKATLIADGIDRDRVEQMSVGQVMAIYSERMYQRYANDMEVSWYVPYWEFSQYDRKVDQRLRDARPLGGGAEREVLPIVSNLLPAVQAARNAQMRMERDLAAIRVIEALRLYAAANEGKLPETLDAVTQVPVPLNPATGKPFVYRLEEQTAIIELPKSDGIPNHTRRFEIKIAK